MGIGLGIASHPVCASANDGRASHCRPDHDARHWPGQADGQLARSDLDRGEVGFQAWLLTVTAFLGTLAGLTAAEHGQAATVGQQR
jgi:hypothetical protein